ncbi:MAG: formate/nitrite transporter family protein [Lautropia sp.]|nr:formate/nitrite transporter family protein [Lautropia sp.]
MAAPLAPSQILDNTVTKGVDKARMPWATQLSLGFLGGAFISVGYLAYLRIAATFHGELAGLGHFLGSAVFPLGLICILIGGGELITGNMMVLPAAWFRRRLPLAALVHNAFIITLANLAGALFVAWAFGHVAGLTEGDYLPKTIAAAHAKVDAAFWPALVSGIGCNWLVGMGVWLCYSADSTSGKILGIWFPVMSFVLIGFQHVVANMFVIPAAIWGGADIGWAAFAHNMVAVWIGNALGGALMVAGLYCMAGRNQAEQRRQASST